MDFQCAKVEQITLFLENRLGILADLCVHLSESKINIQAISTLDATDIGSVRLVVDRPDLAKEVFTEVGVPYSTTSYLAVRMPNHPGGFASIARMLSLAGINIDYIYASSIPDTAMALGIFGVSDPDRAIALDWQL